MNLLDVVTLIEDLPEKGLRKGQIGTIVEELDPRVYEVEFTGLDGGVSAIVAVPEKLLNRLEATVGAGRTMPRPGGVAR
jgi:hypothetical protein